MKADQLIAIIQNIGFENNIHLSKLEVNFRQSYDDDVVAIDDIAEDLFSEDNSTLSSICLLPLLEDE